MKEAIDGCTVWEDVSEDTFIRFGQYVYTGDYSGASPFEPPASPTPPPTEEPGEPSDAPPDVEAPAEERLAPFADDALWAFLTANTKPKKDNKKKAVSEWGSEVSPPQRAGEAWEHFTTTRSYLCAPPSPSDTLENVNNSSKEYAEVFISHAKVYVMADYYLIQPLATLALHKLHGILCNFTLSKKRIPDIVALLQFCYQADERPFLRELVSAYAACKFRKLWTNMAFREVFATYPELSAAVLGNLVERLDW
ncbi:hypothetical protein IF2G_06522 [Cordyceps javanica]|nr:hypothetical protein IF2G_06522 [Cordyceps javanica]